MSAGPHVLAREESFPVPGCSTDSGRRHAWPWCRRRRAAGRRFCCGPGSARRAWRTAPRGSWSGVTSATRNGSGCRCSARSGQGPTVHGLLTTFPADIVAADAELAALMAGDELVRGSLAEAERYLALADRGVASVAEDRSHRCRADAACPPTRRPPGCGRGGATAAGPAGTADSARIEAAEDLRALALVSLGIAELWAARFEEAGRHLEDGVALARRIGRPYLEFTGPGAPGGDRAGAVVCPGARALQGGDRAGRTARLDRCAGRRP
jgi:hypothetical protein